MPCRYDLYGGNPCTAAQADPSHICDICVSDAFGGWDYDAKPGFWVLWSATGRSDYIVSGPHAAPTQVDGKGLLDSPAELELQDGEELVVLFMAYSQYSGWKELQDGVDRFADGGCTQELSHGDARDAYSFALMLEKVEVVSRGEFAPPEGPAVQQMPTDELQLYPDYSPNLFGTDGVWISNTMAPFFDLPCIPGASAFSYGGVTGGKGVASFKSAFELAVLGYTECETGQYGTPPATIEDHPAAKLYFRAPAVVIRIAPKQQALHLLRRMHACHRGVTEALGDGGGCQFSLADTVRFREAVIDREMGDDWGHVDQGEAETYGTQVGVWWWEFPWQGAGGYDFKTSETVAYYSLFLDTLRPYLSAENVTAIEEQMGPRIDHFLDIFDEGRWPLWNGNNWTPSMCIGAAYWSVVYWNREPAKARKVLQVIYDINFWHRKMYTDEPLSSAPDSSTGSGQSAIFNSTKSSVYLEGLSYSAISSVGIFKLADVLRPSFGEIPPSIAAFSGRLTAAASWMFWMTSTDGYQVPFGDSHPKLGYDNTLLRSMMAKEALWQVGAGDVSAAERSQAMSTALAADRACDVRRFFTAAGYQHPVGNPFTFPPELAKDWAAIVAACVLPSGGLGATYRSGQPLGAGEDAVFTVGGYGAFRSPLLPSNYATDRCATNGTDTLCFQPTDDPTGWYVYGSTAGFGCLSQSAANVTMADATPYSFFAIQTKDANEPHTERDFATLLWSGWGTRWLSEHGYGTISSGALGGDQDDVRRLANTDNNPAGHNTLIVRQADPAYPLPASPGVGRAWGTKDELQFSQLNYAHGSTSRVAGLFGRDCVDVDAGPVYGSQRPGRDGWFDAFHRYACPLPGGHFLLLDAFSTMADRSPARFGYDYSIPGPYFDEVRSDGTAGANERLDVDSYFHTPTTSTLLDAATRAESAPDRPSFCAGHVDVDVTGPANSVVRLSSICGQGKNRNADGVGIIAGWGLRGGGFVHDGLVSAEDTNGNPIYTRRFRWQGEPVGPEGDVRSYVLASAPAVGSTVGGCRQAEAQASVGEAPLVDRMDIEHAEQYSAPNQTVSDVLLESATVLTDEGDPVAWTGACPEALSQSSTAGCHNTTSGRPCVCVEACAGGLLYWVRLDSSSESAGSSADVQMSQLEWVGTCTQSGAMRSRLIAAAPPPPPQGPPSQGSGQGNPPHADIAFYNNLVQSPSFEEPVPRASWDAIGAGFALSSSGVRSGHLAAAITGDLASFDEGTLSIAAFNIQVLGVTKMGKPAVVKTLCDIIRRYDLVVVQEIRDASGTAVAALLEAVNAPLSASEEYGLLLSDRLGHSTAKEQYGYFYRTSSLAPVASYHFDDVSALDDVFSREPFVALWESGGVRFSTIPCHITPSRAPEELAALPAVYAHAVATFGVNESVLLGDFNADCSYLTASELAGLELYTSSTFSWLIDSGADTTVSATDCAYDRVIVAGNLVGSVSSGDASVMRFDTEYDLTAEQARLVSDHYPVALRLPVGGSIARASTGGAAAQVIDFQDPEGVWPTEVNIRGCSRVLAAELDGCDASGCDGFALQTITTYTDQTVLETIAQFDPAAGGGYHCREFRVAAASANGIRSITVRAVFQGVSGSALFDDVDVKVVAPYCWGATSYCRGVRSSFGPP